LATTPQIGWAGVVTQLIQRRRLALGSVEGTVVQKIALTAIVDQADNST
jgi:hypothetical protein